MRGWIDHSFAVALGGRCDGASDLVFADARAVQHQVLTVRVSPPFANGELSPSTEAAEHCEVLNQPWPSE